MRYKRKLFNPNALPVHKKSGFDRKNCKQINSLFLRFPFKKFRISQKLFTKTIFQKKQAVKGFVVIA